VNAKERTHLPKEIGMSSPVSNDRVKNEQSEKHMDSPEHAAMLQNAVHDWMTSARPEASGSSEEHSPQAAHILGDFKITDGSASKESGDTAAHGSPEGGASAGKEIDKGKELDQLAQPEGHGKEMLATPEGKLGDKDNDQLAPSRTEKENREGKLGDKDNDQLAPTLTEQENRDGKLDATPDQFKSGQQGSEKVESNGDSAIRTPELAHGENPPEMPSLRQDSASPSGDRTAEVSSNPAASDAPAANQPQAA
jgi:hypothetical protein